MGNNTMDREPKNHSLERFAGEPSAYKKQKQFVMQLRSEWNSLWSEQFDDKIKAEGISARDYNQLRVDKGTVIHATRDFKALSFKEILEEQMDENPDQFMNQNESIGGLNKFIKTHIVHRSTKRSDAGFTDSEKNEVQQRKKGGRGWLHRV